MAKQNKKQAPEMTLNVQGYVMQLMHEKIQEIIEHIREVKNVHNYSPAHLQAKTKRINESVLRVSVMYKGDLWLSCIQTLGINGIETVEFKSKYVPSGEKDDGASLVN